MKKFLWFLLLPLSLFSLTLKEKIMEGEVGDFVLFESRGMHSLVFIKSKDSNKVVIEEIIIPSKKKALDSKASLQKWLNDGAPHHAGWLEFTLVSEGSLKIYSPSRKIEIAPSKTDSFLHELLTSPLTLVSTIERKKKGAPPLAGEGDHRTIWNPPVIFEGEKIPKALCSDWRLYQTGGALAHKPIHLYFSEVHPHFPFPLWIEIEAELGHLKIRSINAGKALILKNQDKL